MLDRSDSHKEEEALAFFEDKKAPRDAQHKKCSGRASSSLAVGIGDRSTLGFKTGVHSKVQNNALSYAYAELRNIINTKSPLLISATP